MRVSNHNDRIDKAARHNDRNFDVTRSDHIDADRSSENIYWTYDGDLTMSFKEKEMQFYKEHFKAHLDMRNKSYKKTCNKNAIHNMDYYHSSERTRPEDKILQIGDVKEHATAEQLWECALEYQKRFNEKYGDRCKILDMALHVDEATPHVHVRRVWIGHDDEGNECVGQTKALNELGVLPPDTSKPISRYNNAKMTFTYEDQAMFREIARERGLQIEEPDHTRKQSLSILAYKKKKTIEDIDSLNEELERVRTAKAEIEEEEEKTSEELASLKKQTQGIGNVFEDLLLNPMFNGEYEEEVRAARKKDETEWARILAHIVMTKAIDEMAKTCRVPDDIAVKKNAALRKKLRAAEAVIKEHHLVREYKQERENTRSLVI
ncbi:MAG: plasmid recombination protein [Candidatus Weimeria sp.]